MSAVGAEYKSLLNISSLGWTRYEQPKVESQIRQFCICFVHIVHNLYSVK